MYMETFKPTYTPKEMLAQGIFGGCYFASRPADWFELPADWRAAIPEPINRRAKDDYYMVEHNRFKVKCGSSLQQWQDAGWINEQDPLGWFQWYCRWYQGIRTTDDARQMRRWKSFVARHMSQLTNQVGGPNGLHNLDLYPTRRQALLHWAWDSTQPPSW